MAENMTLFWGSGSAPCWRVMIALEEKNLQGYKQKLLSFENLEHKSPEVLAVNPRGQLPSFKHGDNILNESYAACFYLENQFKSQGSKLIPDGPAEQAIMYQRMFEGLTFYDKLGAVIYYEYYVPEGERLASAMKRNCQNLITELQLWEGYLDKVSMMEIQNTPKKIFYFSVKHALQTGSHLVGSSFTLADVMVFPTVANLYRFGLSPERYPKLAAYYALLKDRPSIKASWPPHWLEYPKGQDTLKDI
ncbi:glutathione S-transferase A isoform X1 [Syngnathus scovelli]|uniref:glutathione S-transferase A isoform X1 n=1 Tax=Syngnathus scovelli TaxID=161590 RepID=UPI002110A433|nr:glutathione S-transferase A isoform X1 [Syngnathus scovelli]